ncbi:hypothetical protein NC651_023416 [Populus alba x Populus x berolinensis]|nr:hypothetical protein NC651_023416 [Populus alba x Populus x berolinensis]
MFLCKTGRVIDDGKWKRLKLSSWSWLSGQENMVSIILQHFATYFEHLHRISILDGFKLGYLWTCQRQRCIVNWSILHVSSCVVVSFYRESQNVHGGEGIIVEDRGGHRLDILHGDFHFLAAHISFFFFFLVTGCSGQLARTTTNSRAH